MIMVVIIGKYTDAFGLEHIISYEYTHESELSILREQIYDKHGTEINNRIVPIPGEFLNKTIEILKKTQT